MFSTEDKDPVIDKGMLNEVKVTAKRINPNNIDHKADETPGVNVYHNFLLGGNWSYPGLGIHTYPNEPLAMQQHEYGHYLQYKQMNIISYTWDVAIPSSVNLLLINMKLVTDDHDIKPYEVEASSLADKFYDKNSRLGTSSNPTYLTYPDLRPKSSQEQWNDVRRDFNAWASWGGH